MNEFNHMYYSKENKLILNFSLNLMIFIRFQTIDKFHQVS